MHRAACLAGRMQAIVQNGPERAGGGRVHLLVALRAEARPLIEHYRLRGERTHSGLRRLSDSGGSLALVVTGSGKSAAASAVRRLASGRQAAWLNLGIAGHAAHRVGSVFLADTIVDEASGRTWRPVFAFDPPCPTAALRTVDRPCRDFPTDDLYDMEAAGFCEAARSLAGSERVHCLKVVSDNRDQPATALTRERVTELIAANLRPIASVVDALRRLSVEAG